MSNVANPAPCNLSNPRRNEAQVKSLRISLDRGTVVLPLSVALSAACDLALEGGLTIDLADRLAGCWLCQLAGLEFQAFGHSEPLRLFAGAIGHFRPGAIPSGEGEYGLDFPSTVSIWRLRVHCPSLGGTAD